MADATGGGVPFQEAIGLLRDKLRLPTRTWTDIWEGMHARAFVVAGATTDALLADFQGAILKALEQGTTLTEFRRDFDRIVEAHGWKHVGGRNWRSRVIFDTNLRTAHAAGRWAQVQQTTDRRPYLRYVAVLDERTRHDHRAWHGTVLEVDDPWWQTHYPPNGWYCRCTVQSLSERDLERYGYEVSDSPPPPPLVAHQVNTPSGPVTIQVPKGIDPGFAYNVGEAGFGRGPGVKAAALHGEWTALSAPGGHRPSNPSLLSPVTPLAEIGPRVERGDEAGLRDVLRRAIGGEERVFTDPTGARVLIGQALVDHFLEDGARQDGREAYFPFLPELVERPQEIWVGFAQSPNGRVELRRRYVRTLDLGQSRVVGLVADFQGRQLQGYTFFRGALSGARKLRSGLRIYLSE